MGITLQKFNFIVEVRLGNSHANANHLSRLKEESGGEVIDDFIYYLFIYLFFPDAQLLYIDVITQEYEKIIEYLPTDFNDDYCRYTMDPSPLQ